MLTGSTQATTRPRWTRRVWRCVVTCGAVLVLAVGGAAPALAAPADLGGVISNLRVWLVGFLVALATLFLTVGGIRYLAADGDPGEVERAKKSLRNSLIGYSLAALAPIIVTALQSLVG